MKAANLKSANATSRRAQNLRRLLKPRHVCIVGGQAMEDSIRRCADTGFAGEIWVVNPKRSELGGRKCYASIADLPEAPDATFIAVPREPTIDILRALNAAGVNIKNRTLAEMQPDQWDQLLAINATGAYNCMHAVLPNMRERRDGLIINISSTSGKRAWKLGGVAYSASKFAMTALSTAAANELAQLLQVDLGAVPHDVAGLLQALHPRETWTG